jgi:hypothetical protein
LGVVAVDNRIGIPAKLWKARFNLTELVFCLFLSYHKLKAPFSSLFVFIATTCWFKP